MVIEQFNGARIQLTHGRARSFKEPLDPSLPRVAAGCYTIWDDEGRFLYAGMAGRSLSAERITASRNDSVARVSGLRDRLGSHRNGRRSGDQFAVYVFDRFILGSLSAEAIAAAVAGTRRLDDDVREFIQSHLSYRWVETESGEDATRWKERLSPQGSMDRSLS